MSKTMTIKRAIDHFIWKFSNTWKPTKKDIEALNEIIEFVEQKHQKQFNDNLLFAKLYITFYGELLKFYNASVFDSIPEKAINKILDTEIELIIEKFVDKANLVEQTQKQVAKHGYKHPMQVKENLIEPLNEAMTYEEAVDNLTARINFALNKYS